MSPVKLPTTDFNPLPPCGGRRACITSMTASAVFQSTPSVWRETRKGMQQGNRHHRISIHSLRVEGDVLTAVQRWREWNFNPLPPCGGRPCGVCNPTGAWHFNPLPPCGGRPDLSGAQARESAEISIHSLRVEGDASTA